ncbi:MAG: zinc-ribbon domain-containing protein [Solirubrobacteraceae bacterium]
MSVLADGTAYFGRLGEIAYDPDADRVQCHLCGEWFRWVGGTHLSRTHGWTIEEYREAFHLLQQTSTAASGIGELRREQLKRRIDSGELVPLGPNRRPVGRPRIDGPEKMPEWRSLAARRPDLAGQLHLTRNGEIRARQVAVHSQARLWWRCGCCGHQWQATPKDRRHQPAGWCPQCAGPQRTAPKGSRARSLAERPDLLAELDATRNRGVDPTQIAAKSSKKLWWRCPACGHRWQRPRPSEQPARDARNARS